MKIPMVTMRQKIHYRIRSVQRNLRYYFPSPAEMEFARIMGARTITLKWLTGVGKHYPFALIWWKGRLFRREYMKREYRIGPYFADYYFEDSESRKLVEIDGYDYHLKHRDDIVADQRRDEYMKKRGIRTLRIDARKLWREPKKVRRQVIDFLGK